MTTPKLRVLDDDAVPFDVPDDGGNLGPPGQPGGVSAAWPYHSSLEPRRVFVDTFGCQMNAHDSERMVGLMAAEGYAPTEDPECADLIVLNSCSIREKAEHKLLSAAGSLKAIKEKRPDAVLAIAGCVAQQEGKTLLARAPHIDIVFGPDHIGRLPELVRDVQKTRRRLSETAFLSRSEFAFPRLTDAAVVPVSAYVSVMKGCDKFCTFCIVPFTRGREVSRDAADILDEVRWLAARGSQEIVLLGQTVNAYGRQKKAGQMPFHELLAEVAAVPGVRRVRFTSPHPSDFTDAQILAFRDVPELCPHMHLPVQSGSDDVLARMRRGYTRAEYLAVVRRLREVAPNVSLTTDIIVGFPGETEDDFQATLSLVEEVRFQAAFCFAYSERTGTRAVGLEGAIPFEERARRLRLLLERQEQITGEWLSSMVGQRLEVLIEGPSKSDPTRSTGRSGQNRPVHVDGSSPPGTMLDVEVVEAFKHSLRATPIAAPTAA